jgi:hypothetical protein
MNRGTLKKRMRPVQSNTEPSGVRWNMNRSGDRDRLSTNYQLCTWWSKAASFPGSRLSSHPKDAARLLRGRFGDSVVGKSGN